MNIQLLVLEILKNQNIVSMSHLKEKTNVSERKIREVLKDLRLVEEYNGFRIDTVSKRGYFLQILHEEEFQVFLKNQNNDFQKEISRREYRIAQTIFLLLQNTNFITMNQIAEILDVSRSTVINDMEEVKQKLKKYDIELVARSHYGVKVQGTEQRIRQLLSKISRNIVENQHISFEFFEYIAELDFSEETEKFMDLLSKHEIHMTNSAMESILFHLKIMIFRTVQKNFINEVNINKKLIDKTIYKVTNEIITFIEKKHQIKVTNDEIDLVASQIFGKTNSEKIPLKQKQKMKNSIRKALEKIDRDYETAFSGDEILKENLLLHAYPLLMRVSSGLSLSDSLIGSISVQYMNAFLVAIRFIDHHKELSHYELSRDEIGYLALHFATHIERQNQEKLQRIKKIVLVIDDMRSTSILLKTKLQSFFPFSKILEIPFSTVQKYPMDDVELIISTEDIKIPDQQSKVILVKGVLDEQEIRKIKNEILFNELNLSQKALGLQDLFFEDLFFVREKGEYLELIREMCEKMMINAYAQRGFTESVIERENRFSTIYENGVAAPHSLIQMANIDSIGVILLKNPITYNKKKVSCILLINVKKGHLLLHHEISDFIMRLMNDKNKMKILQLISTYQKFREFIKDVV